MSYFMSCQKCGKETIGRYATEDSLCGECISDIDKLSAEKLQEQLNTAKKALTESEKMYQKQMDRFLNSEMNESARSHCESQLKLLKPAHKAYQALAAIGVDDDNY